MNISIKKTESVEMVLRIESKKEMSMLINILCDSRKTRALKYGENEEHCVFAGKIIDAYSQNINNNN